MKASLLFQYLFYASKNSYETDRRYQNFQDLLGSLTGIGSLLMIIMTFIVNFYTKVKAVKEVLNCLYVLPQPKKQKIIKTHHIRNISVVNTKKNQSYKEIKIKNKTRQKQINFFDKPLDKKTTADIQSFSSKIEHLKKFPDNFIKFGENEQNPMMLSLNKQTKSVFPRPLANQPKTEPSELKLNLFENLPNKKIVSQISKEEICMNTPLNREINDLCESKEKLINDKKMQMDFSVWEYVKYLFFEAFGCKKNKKYKAFSRAINVYEKEIDLFRILIKIHEIEKMKIIFFNEAQANLFDSLSKPILDFEEEPIRNRLGRKSFTLNKIFSLTPKGRGNKGNGEFIESYKFGKACKDSEVNARLLKLVNLDLMKLKEKEI